MHCLRETPGGYRPRGEEIHPKDKRKKMNVNRQSTAPLSVPRTRRNHGLAVMTSLPAGKCVPLAAIPLLREDGLRGRFRVAVEMQETKELLMNPVNLRVTAYLVPLLAMARFEGSRDQFDRSYMGQKKTDDAGAVVVPFIETHAVGTHGSNAVYTALGLHGKPTDQVNTAYLEAYNAAWNFRARNRSANIAERARLASDLAPAFWPRSRFEHVVPDFDQAVIDGEVALNVVEARLPVRGIGFTGAATTAGATAVRETQPSATVSFNPSMAPGGLNIGGHGLAIAGKADGGVVYPDVFAELAQNGVTVSLSNLELAKKTQAFAKLRERFDGHDDEYIVDMLMDGLTIPDQALKQPILLADQSVRFVQAKRYATDAGNLAESAVSGAAMVDISLRVPRLATGGVVIVVAECIPEQLFERQRDPFFHSVSVDTWPEYLRDTLDPEKVEVVKNGEIDTDHATPDATFGYAPLNWRWNAMGPRVGGKFYRPSTNTSTDEERQRLWAVENVNPVLSEDFYLVNSMHTKPFLDTQSDPFEATIVGNCVIDGNTVFGGMLVESTSNYDEVLEKAPQERIEK
nr:MAG: major capsid protein [Microvirus sp.]